MEQGLIKVNKKLFVLLLICLVVFLIFPKISLAEDFENITSEQIGKYLQLPADKVESLIHSLINLFNSEWINQISSAYSTPEESAVPNIMRAVVRVQALNHLLIDAPIEVTWKIINNAIKIARLVGIQDVSGILNELEKQSVEKAIGYGISVLFENEIRMTPGAIALKYITQKGETKEAIFQYVIIYQPINQKVGKLVIRFYSPGHLEPPGNKGSYGGTLGYYTELTHPLPPFIVDIQGEVENYQWKGDPSMKIDFPAEVPDLGIKPLSFWERNVLKPIQTTIKEVEIIITKASGGSSKIVENLSKIPKVVNNAWNKIKSMVSKLNPFGAEVTQVFSPSGSITGQLEQPSQSEQADQSSQATEFNQTDEQKEIVGNQSQQPEPKPEPKLTLAELQEMLDDIAEKIDIFSRQVSELVEAKNQQTEKEIEEIEEDEEEIKELEKKEVVVCSININTASKEELQKITGVGPVIAQRIIEARPFSSVYDLKRVSGIGEITLQGIIGQSCAYVVGDTGLGSGGGASPSAAVTYPKILISEVQIWDNTSNDHDFIELYNPGSNSEDISGFQLKKRSSTGSESSISLFPTGSIIPAKDYFLWANSNYASSTSLQANVATSQTLAQNNSLALLDPDKNIVDALAWGSSTNPFFEGSPFPQSPEKGKSLGRKWSTTTQSYIDTDDNSADFEIQNPTTKAKNQSPESGPEPEPEPTPPFSVVINEIAWMGTATSSTDEWIELYNNSTSTIDLTDWTLKADDGTPSITFSTSGGTTTIPAFSFYLLERTNDNTISDILADQIYTGALENEGEKLELRDSADNLIDVVDFSSGWPAGTSSADYLSMERINPRTSGSDSTNWANNNTLIKNGLDAEGNPINGTPRAQNSVYQSLPPAEIIDLAIDSQNSYSNRATLTWSSSTDPDTPSEDLSYQIYYLKESLNKDNLESASTSSTTATTITISDLDYNSTYYFGVKAFDGQNYSELSNIVSYQIPSALVNSAWPRFKKDSQRSGQSDFLGPQAAPTIAWVYEEEINPNNPDLNPLYTSPIIRPEGTIFSSVIYPTFKKGILALNPDGSKKWFQEENIDFPLALQPDGSVLADDISRAWSEDEKVYYFGQNDTLYAFDKNGNEKWKKQFEFMDPKQYLCSSRTPSVITPAIGKDGIIYVVVQNNACSSQWDRADYLYAISPENEIIWQVSLGGYNSSLPTVSADNTVYVFNFTYPVSYPILWLKAISEGNAQWAKSFDNNFKSLPIVDSQGNIYFSIGKKVYGSDKEGGEIWQIYLVDAPSNWEIVSDFLNGLALSIDGVLYLSGRGAIFALK